MAGLEGIGTVRAFGLGLAAALLSACASAPAPISALGEGASPAPEPPPYDASAPPHILAGRAPLQCVPFAREESGIQIFGDANTWWRQAAGRYPRSSSPAPGSVLVMRGYRDPGRGHVAVVAQIVSSRIILVDQANWLNQGEISMNVPVVDVSPDNDWSEVRVWYIPNRQWGARIYRTHGFIHPFLLTAEIN
ncbi:MAG: CHAP domain-containing protein [Proteobacteria bacterium]|nr:CHAP domain-containing protein [Pseudomonadota bacterium]